MQWTWLSMGIILGCAPLCWGVEPASPYAGQEQREIKALSVEEVQGYLSGSGMGLAKVAELHHYPGPKHVLDLAEPLQLSTEQRQKTQSILEDMQTEAVRLGTHLIEKERQLDALFAAGTIAEAQLDQLVTEIGTIQGQLRAVHLRAHLAQRAILTPGQVRRYDTLRGYNTSLPDHSGPHRGH
jgi:Spy/CpxP family protein refolding chaperone